MKQKPINETNPDPDVAARIARTFNKDLIIVMWINKNGRLGYALSNPNKDMIDPIQLHDDQGRLVNIPIAQALAQAAMNAALRMYSEIAALFKDRQIIVPTPAEERKVIDMFKAGEALRNPGKNGKDGRRR